MATVAAPYGLRPVKRMDGMPYAGATTQYLINPAGDDASIFNGSIVYLDANGYIVLSEATGADLTTNNFGGSGIGAIGVFVGCEYVNAQGQLIHSQYYPANYAAPTGTAIKAYVVDDPFVLFQAQYSTSGAQTIIGLCATLSAVQSTSTGSTQTGNSTSAVVASSTGCLRIVAHVSPASDAYPDVLVKFNPSGHMLTDDTTN